MEKVMNGVGETEVFEVDQTPSFYNSGQRICLQNPRLKCLRHTNRAKEIFIFA